MKQALTIAGSDSSGGAGIQADLKTFHAHGVFGASVLTAVTAQSTRAVGEVLTLPPALIVAQLDAVLDDLDIAAAKTGMLSSADVIDAVAGALSARRFSTLVVDPVMISKSGYRLLQDDAVGALRNRLLPLALVATPNLHEAGLLAGMQIASLVDMRRAAEHIAGLGPRAVVVKGGHASFALATDVLFMDGTVEELRPDSVVEERSIHGTGCAFSAAIAAELALGESVPSAVRRAKRYITRAIRQAPAVGSGHPPAHHFYFLEPGDWDVEPGV
ncbi:MAG TPA: bifunctional hydroxymethylpyrimidine kinase/phosphomethylpyrimidine kinase [Candidatus Krumholzibacteria bacterium]|nr:bifunctional hydroxymethylpyrimidine kinase/phosphomethylpyrimidine kinase [Candidatus Krumholzibacteria bacterium]